MEPGRINLSAPVPNKEPATKTTEKKKYKKKKKAE
jgi:hypothetical protein